MDKPEDLLPSTETFLPFTRIKSIMKCRGASQINNEALFVMAKSTELFVKYLATEALETSKKNATDKVKYEHVAQLVNNSKKLDFLQQFVPEKISVSEFKEIISGNDDNDDTDDEEGSCAESKD